MKRSLFLSELKLIATNRKLLVPILAVIFIPILYAGMFLWSFWNPYSHMQDLPVAVVNADTGAEYEGESLTLGEDLVERLKENEEFQFHFVSKDEAYTDLDNQKYYMVVEIPEDFSTNATTLMEDQPKMLQLKYVPNEGYNFLSAQIGETAVNEIKSSISSEVSSTYAETIFGKITEMAGGLTAASDGALELQDGADQLKNGTDEIRENLERLASKSIEFQNGVNVLESGTGDLAEGIGEISTGLGQLTDANSQLLDAAKDVESGADQLATGIEEADAGINAVKQKSLDLADGSTKLKNGMEAFQQQLPTDLGTSIGEQLKQNGQEVTAGLGQLQDQLSEQLSVGIADQITTQQAEQMEQLVTVLEKAGIDTPTVQAITQQVKQNAITQDTLQNQLQSSIDQGIGEGFETYKSEVSNQISSATDDLENKIKTAVDPTFNQLYTKAKAIEAGQKSLQEGIGKIASSTEQLRQGTLQLASGQTEYVNHMKEFSGKLVVANNGAAELIGGANEINQGTTKLADGSEKINSGVQQLADGSIELAAGSSQLYNGTDELYGKLSEASTKANAVDSDDKTYDMIGSPVKVNKEEINTVPNYGTGFAPYFISLGLFVGALLITIVYPLRSHVIEPINGFSWFLGKFGIIAIVSIAQVILVDSILLFGLGIQVESIPYFVLASIITSLTFMTLIQFLVTLMGDTGRFIAIVILILQLTTSAGTFPLELIPNTLQPISAFLPMTYSVKAFKAVISSGDLSFMWSNLVILSCYILVAMGLTISFFVFKHKRIDLSNTSHS